MKGALLYVDAGKGHYIPAIALEESFKETEHEVVVENLFVVLDSPRLNSSCKKSWRFLLHHPKVEYVWNTVMDETRIGRTLQKIATQPVYRKNFKQWYEQNKPDFIVSTNFIGGYVLPKIIKKLGLNIPVFQYAADVFDTPQSGINNKLTKMYMPSLIGYNNAVKKGQKKETLTICPFPLQKKFEKLKALNISKQEMRAKLGLEDKFTILYNLGGEGIGSIDFLNEMAKRGHNWQVLLIGGKSSIIDRKLALFNKLHPKATVHKLGFINNVPEYLVASDIQIGKAGTNALLEAVYMSCPCLISDILFAAKATKEFFKEYPLGWGENDAKKQVKIVEDYIKKLDEGNHSNNNPGIEFSSDKLRDLILKDTDDYYNNLNK